MGIIMFVYMFLLFFVLTPGILLSFPPKGSKIVVALTHALVFAIVWHFTSKMVWRSTNGLFEGMYHMSTPTPGPMKEGYGCDKKDKRQ